MQKILSAEDDADSCKALLQFLERAGYEVECANNGKEALKKILDQTPDLIILDLFMPDMDGASLLEVVRSYLRLQSVPVIVWTGLSDSPLLERARALKVNAIVAKGKASFQEIVEAVKQEIHRLPT